MAAVAANYKEFEKLGVQFISMSVDSIYTHKIWQKEELSKMVDGGVPFPMLSDPAGRVGERYGVYANEAGVDIRGRFLIDPDGVIQAMEVLTPPVGRSIEEMIRQVQAYQLVRETKGAQVCPASWKPGEATLKPKAELVGKVWKEWKPRKCL